MHVFGCVAYAMVLDEQMNKLHAKGTKSLFLDCCEGTEACRPICSQTKKIIKNRGVVFMEDDTSVGKTLEICLSGKN